MKTVGAEMHANVELYARPVDEVVVFSDQTVLILSEREADGYLTHF